MPTAVLQTKLYTPETRLDLVPRARLIDKLRAGCHRKLTLISAPAGFGKTTLVSEWIARCERPAAWLSLDEGDNDPTRFLTYLVAALQAMPIGEKGAIASNGAQIGEGVLSLLQSPQSLPLESVLTALLNEIVTISDNFILVLDDYHLLNAKPIDDALTFLLDHLPSQMHLVIATRADPRLPLARYRVLNQMTELRETDLRFTPAESAGFLNQAMGLTLSAEEIAALETRTEGWIAGLQLAVLAMQGLSTQGQADTTRFIQTFTGSHRFVLDYLVEEVLQRQTESVRSFLLHTAILDRLSGPLCNAITGEEDGQGMLEDLERGNLFVVPLDDRREWYRYHHLFAEVLHAHSMAEHPEELPTLHRRASEWFEQNDLLPDAIRHAFAAKDFERAARLIELVQPTIGRSSQAATWLGWVRALPDEMVRVRPVLSVGYAWALLGSSELEVSRTRLQDAERWLDVATDMIERSETTSPEMGRTEMVVVDEALFRSLPATIATSRAYIAQALGNVPSSVTYAQQALDLLTEHDDVERAVPATLLGTAYWASGDLEAAHQSFSNFMAIFQVSGNIPMALTGTSFLADIRITQGRLYEAVKIYEQSLKLALSYTNAAGARITEQGESLFLGMTELYVGLSELHCERGDLEAAAQHLLRSEELGEQAMIPGNEYRLYPAIARIKAAQGDLDGALNLLNEAERLYYKTPLPDVRPLAAQKTRIWVRQGRLTEALRWVRERGVSVDDDLSYLHEFEHVTLARVLIAQYKSEKNKRDQVDRSIREVMGLLSRLLKVSEEGGRMGSVIEILMLQALAYEAQGNISCALAPLVRALTLAEPEGYVRLFVDEGPPMRALLREAAKQGIAPNYVRQLRIAFGEPESKIPVAQSLIEPLSPRELELLALVADGLSNRQISDKLVISIATTKKHMSNVLGKLSASNRTEAVRRAQDLQLL